MKKIILTILVLVMQSKFAVASLRNPCPEKSRTPICVLKSALISSELSEELSVQQTKIAANSSAYLLNRTAKPEGGYVSNYLVIVPITSPKNPQATNQTILLTTSVDEEATNKPIDIAVGEVYDRYVNDFTVSTIQPAKQN